MVLGAFRTALNRVRSKVMKKLALLIPALLLWDLVWPLFGVGQITPRRLKRILRDDREGVALIDVRTTAEYRWFHIPGARSMPELLLHPETYPRELQGREAVLICMTGHRSPVTAYRLHQRHGVSAANLTWGMVGWLASGGKVVRGEQRGGETEK
jgi:rhodanese-related sulfurtransferase